MSYLDFKTWHVIVACCLTAVFFYAMLPLRRLLFSSEHLSDLQYQVGRFFRRQLYAVLPTAVIQVALGMATLFSEPMRVSAGLSVLLMAGVVLLAFIWLIGLGLSKNSTDQKAVRRLVFGWLIALGFIMLVILYVMVNMGSMC